ncbi:VOC family protein [Microtetraspora sp. AC03309]|uniref:VOC family protein n=1 Tax=Microtetraspora sp. AC03309 TaxID=2779376 RepID=UPI0027E11424|nr:VOC family protein [Microtetraspora sp. AC03309]
MSRRCGGGVASPITIATVPRYLRWHLFWRRSGPADLVLLVRPAQCGRPGVTGRPVLIAEEKKTGPNQMHFDLTSTSLEDQQRTVARSLELGARHIDVGRRPEEDHVVLADPDGNEFCVSTPR